MAKALQLAQRYISQPEAMPDEHTSDLFHRDHLPSATTLGPLARVLRPHRSTVRQFQDFLRGGSLAPRVRGAPVAFETANGLRRAALGAQGVVVPQVIQGLHQWVSQHNYYHVRSLGRNAFVQQAVTAYNGDQIVPPNHDWSCWVPLMDSLHAAAGAYMVTARRHGPTFRLPHYAGKLACIMAVDVLIHMSVQFGGSLAIEMQPGSELHILRSHGGSFTFQVAFNGNTRRIEGHMEMAPRTPTSQRLRATAQTPMLQHGSNAHIPNDATELYLHARRRAYTTPIGEISATSAHGCAMSVDAAEHAARQLRALCRLLLTALQGAERQGLNCQELVHFAAMLSENPNMHTNEFGYFMCADMALLLQGCSQLLAGLSRVTTGSSQADRLQGIMSGTAAHIELWACTAACAEALTPVAGALVIPPEFYNNGVWSTAFLAGGKLPHHQVRSSVPRGQLLSVTVGKTQLKWNHGLRTSELHAYGQILNRTMSPTVLEAFVGAHHAPGKPIIFEGFGRVAMEHWNNILAGVLGTAVRVVAVTDEVGIKRELGHGVTGNKPQSAIDTQALHRQDSSASLCTNSAREQSMSEVRPMTPPSAGVSLRHHEQVPSSGRRAPHRSVTSSGVGRYSRTMGGIAGGEAATPRLGSSGGMCQCPKAQSTPCIHGNYDKEHNVNTGPHPEYHNSCGLTVPVDLRRLQQLVQHGMDQWRGEQVSERCRSMKAFSTIKRQTQGPVRTAIRCVWLDSLWEH
jgi:hypothetical protein